LTYPPYLVKIIKLKISSHKGRPTLGYIDNPKEVKNLANIKSAKKRILVTAKRQVRNRHIKSSTKTAIKKLTSAVGAGQTDNVNELLSQATAAIDTACSKGVYHKNTAARKKSRLARLVNRAV